MIDVGRQLPGPPSLEEQHHELLEFMITCSRAYGEALWTFANPVTSREAQTPERHVCDLPDENTPIWTHACPICSVVWKRQLGGGWLPETKQSMAGSG